ncbi:GntR family transcriptional regulator [Paraburkholderia sp. BR13439]|uniref:GntR family transcriptional regulator n=1 Tax=Paraburkholderia TaxID=1822464 RepID=UPI0034CE2538
MSSKPALSSLGSNPDEHAPMQQRVYAHIKAMIQDGRIRPGERLLEVHVARAFAVSRSPARRALEALCIDKAVRAAPGRGYIVVGRRADDSRGDLANIAEMIVEPMPRWKQVYAEMERQVCIGVVYHSLRITEERVAEHFDVSRTVARDALGRLHSLGMVSKDRQGRWEAERITADRLHALYELRWLLEPQALMQSARAIPRERVREAHDRLRAALDDMPQLGSDTHISLEKDLHIELLSACPNQELLRVLDRTHSLLVSNPHRLKCCVGEPQAHLESSLREHLDVLGLWLDGRLEAAAAALCQHLQESCAFWIDSWGHVEARPTPPLPSYLTPTD